jgi:glycerol-1-phosphate dehydrogenase [NAD(P)+]
VAELPGSRDAVVVLAAATPMSVSGRDLRSAIEEALSHRFRVKWVTLGPASAAPQPVNARFGMAHALANRVFMGSGAGPATGAGHAGAQLHADEATVATAAAAAARAGCVVTVGSGTITDIGKAAARPGTPLVAVQTATSVNGYADPFSVLLRRGVKRTTPTRWPDTLVIDPEVLGAAPPELNRAGVGDLMAMFTASADWYLAAAIGSGLSPDLAAAQASRAGQPAAGADPLYIADVAGLTLAHAERLLALAASPDARPDAGPGRLAELARILTLSGIAMGVAGSTAPASGMEHAVSHLLEMAAAARGIRASFHGTQVAVGSIVAAASWAQVRRRIAGGALSRAASLPDPDNARDRITQAFAPIDPTGAMAAECFCDYAAKLRRLSSGPDDDPLASLRASWPDHDAMLDRLLITPGELARGLLSAGLPVRFRDLPEPVSDADARWAVASCMLMRQRFSVADLAVLIGGFQDADIDEVLAAAQAAADAAETDAADAAADRGQP